MSKIDCQPRTKEFTYKVFKALLDFAYLEEDKRDRAIGCEWVVTGKVIQFTISKRQLQDLYGGRHDEKIFADEIRPAVRDYLGKVLGVVKNMTYRKDLRKFELHLWDETKENNLQCFDREWNFRAKEWNSQKVQVSSKKSAKNNLDTDWRSACKAQLERQKQQITSSPLHRKARDLDSVHVPLGLVERKERPKIDRTQEISPERGSAAEQPENTEKRVEHEAFLAEIGKRQPGEHLVILGEPGAGKTTLLTKVWEWLLEHEQPGEDLIVAWVPLAAVKNNELEEYLHKSWIKQFCKTSEIDRYWASFEVLADAGRVWLLLDGADEMGGEALGKIEGTLREAWTRSTRAIITCRLNLWDANSTNQLQTSPNFQVYRTLDFKYVNPARQDEVKSFIDNWFQSTEEPDAGQKLRAALDEVGKERIKDLAQNPLRLTLLCAIWGDDRALPETQAGLYELFVDYVYKWKATEFPVAVNMRGELDRAMGNLAKQGINKPSLRFRFTEAELRKWVPEVEQCQALMDLGWLNCVGEENQRPVFAFFHPTFQEYFAACSIDDWDYFLPKAHDDRPVPCLGEEEIGPTYRVFESEWRQPMLLWFGREDIKSELKEKFIEKLMDFRGQEGLFYSDRAYFIAAILIGEFKYSKWSKEIVEECIEGAFGYFNTEKQDWINYLVPIQSLALKTIFFTHRGYAIDALEAFLNQPILDDYMRYRVALALGGIDGGNQTATDALVALLQQPDLNDYMKFNIAADLKKVASGNQNAINTLVALLQNPDLDMWLTSRAIEALGKVSGSNQIAIDALVMFLQQPNLDAGIQVNVARTLGEISGGNQKAIDAIMALLRNPNSDRWLILKAIGKIAGGNPTAVNDLVEILLQPPCPNVDKYHVVEALIEIANGKQKETVIDTLITLLEEYDLDSSIQFLMIEGLGKIAIGNQKAIKTLFTLLNQLNLDDNLRYTAGFALGEIAIGNQRQTAIGALVSLLRQPTLDDNLRYRKAFNLGRITIGNQKKTAIDILVSLLQQTTLSDILRYRVIFALGEIADGNQKAIDALVAILLKPKHQHQLKAVEALAKIAGGNQKVIDALVALLQQHNLDKFLLSKVVEALRGIAGGNQKAINALAALLQQHDSADDVRGAVEEILEAILTKEIMIKLIRLLKDNVNSVTDEVYEFNYKVYDSCHKILFQCAQALTYQGFYAAWHLPIPISPDLANRPNTIILNITDLNNYTTSDITTEISIRIYQQLAITPIPETPTISQLLNLQLSPHLLIILENLNPTETLITEITKLHTPKKIQILWLTPTPNIPNAYHPDQENLASAIQSAIDRFTE
jgi:HEAT repeat protein/energy-coupling factor transporter ATP-binding protein EcfA2